MSVDAGLVAMGGTFEVEIALVARGVVRTTWLGGIAVPFFSFAYIKSRL